MSITSRPTQSAFLILTLSALATMPVRAITVGATPGQSSTPGSLAVTCVGEGNGGYVRGGESMSPGGPSGGQFNSFATSTCDFGTSASPGASLSQAIGVANVPSNGVLYSGSAAASISLKQIHLQAQLTSPSRALFPNAAAQAGWTDTWTPNGQPAGTMGLALAVVHVSGKLHEAGFYGTPGLMVTPYVNGSLINRNSTFDSLNPTPVIGNGSSVGFQTRRWDNPGISFTANAPDLVLNQDIIFAIPVTFGTQMSLGLYAMAFGGLNGFGGFFDTVANSSASDFSNTLTWGGIQQVLVAGAPVSFGITSGSGIDWTTGLIPTAPPGPPNAAPEPASFGLVVAGLLLSWRARRR